MYQDVVIINGPIWDKEKGVSDFERVRIKGRPLGRPYVWDNAPEWNKDEKVTTNGGIKLVFEEEGGSIYIQEIEWEVVPYPSSDPNPRTYYYYEKYDSLEEARAGQYGWFVRFALGETEDVW